MNGPTPSFEAIAARAYQKWEAAGRPDGRSDEFWLQAERELRATGNKSAGGSPPNPNAQFPEAGGGTTITNTDRALPPEQRRRVRAARHREAEPGARPKKTAAAASPSAHYIVVLDRAHLRIYRAQENFGPSQVDLQLEAAVDLPAGKARYTSSDTDQAGRFPGLRGAPRDAATASGGSIDERLPMQQEHDRQIVADLASQLGSFLQKHPEATWDYAAPPPMHHAVLAQLPDAARDRLGVTLLKDLVNQPVAELRSHFVPEPAQR